MAARIDLLAGSARCSTSGADPGDARGRRPRRRHAPTDVTLTLCDLSPGMVDGGRAPSHGRHGQVDGRRSTGSPPTCRPCRSRDRRLRPRRRQPHAVPPAGSAGSASPSWPRRRAGPTGSVVAAHERAAPHARARTRSRRRCSATAALDRTVDVFGAEVGFALPAASASRDVRWLPVRRTSSRCTDPADVLAYSCSSPPGEDATAADGARGARGRRAVAAPAYRGRAGRRRDAAHRGRRPGRSVPPAGPLAGGSRVELRAAR